MKVLLSNKYTDILNGIPELIEKELSNCQEYQEIKNLIFITDNEYFSELKTKIKTPSYLDGFACNIGKYNFAERNVPSCHIIILNIANIKKAELSVNELIAVILHELGHILNSFYSDNYNYFIYARVNGIEHKQIVVESDFKMECEYYADFFVKEHGFKDSLIGALNKSDEKIYNQSTKQVRYRKNKLNSEELFKGQIRGL